MAKRILAIDPGTVESGWVEYDAAAARIVGFGKTANAETLALIRQHDHNREVAASGGHDDHHHIAIEMVASYGMPVGREVFETCVWVGRFMERWNGPTTRLTRIEIKSHLCHSARAKDSNIRQALIDRLGPPGTKKAPGPTYGIKGDIWSALAVAVTCADQLEAQIKALDPEQ